MKIRRPGGQVDAFDASVVVYDHQVWIVPWNVLYVHVRIQVDAVGKRKKSFDLRKGVEASSEQVSTRPVSAIASKREKVQHMSHPTSICLVGN